MTCSAMMSFTGASQVSATSLTMLLEGLRQVGLAIEEIKELRDLHGQAHATELVVRNQAGDQLGIVKTGETGALHGHSAKGVGEGHRKPGAPGLRAIAGASPGQAERIPEREGREAARWIDTSRGAAMAVKQEMEFVIGPDGEIRWTTTNLKGAELKDAHQALEKAVGPVKERSHSDHAHGEQESRLAPVQIGKKPQG